MKKTEQVNVNGELIHLRKDFLGWHTVNPIKDGNGKINWKNLIAGGSWIKLLLIIGFVIICIMAMIEVRDLAMVANTCQNINILKWN